MGSLGNPQAWVPYDNSKDCSQGFCSLYCPQWCYLFPPPPPFGFPDDDSSPSFSPLVIAIIGILGSAFLLVCYYTLLSKYCGDLDSLRRRRRSHDPSEEFEANHNQMHSESWQAPTGLDETLIKSIGVCKYKKGDRLVEGSECSVCLGEFHEDENLRLLPKCNHSFHLSCIDTWLRSHSNCPLCRANIVSISPLPVQIPPPVPENPSDNRHYTVVEVEISGRSSGEGTSDAGAAVPKTPSQGLSRPRDVEERDTIIEISEDRVQQIRRSVSMDSSCQGHVSIADILSTDQDDDLHMDDHRFPMSVESSKEHRVEHSKSNNRNRVLHCVTGHSTVMKRSFSSGRFLFTRHEKGRNSAGEIDFCKCIKEDNTVE